MHMYHLQTTVYQQGMKCEQRQHCLQHVNKQNVLSSLLTPTVNTGVVHLCKHWCLTRLAGSDSKQTVLDWMDVLQSHIS